jgi:hypothetical protein
VLFPGERLQLRQRSDSDSADWKCEVMNQPLFEGSRRELPFWRKRLICLWRVNLSILYMRMQIRRFHNMLRDNPENYNGRNHHRENLKTLTLQLHVLYQYINIHYILNAVHKCVLKI